MNDTCIHELVSNVKVITSGKIPTTENLTPGQMAFGKINDDSKYHIYGNAGEGVVDIGLDATVAEIDAIFTVVDL